MIKSIIDILQINKNIDDVHKTKKINKIQNNTIKILLIGGCVGKSTILYRYDTGKYNTRL